MLRGCLQAQLSTLARRISSRRYSAMAATTAPAWREWRLNPPTAIPSSSATLSHHKDLGKLPVPPLKQTVEKLYRSASVLAKDDAELRQLKQRLDAFAEPGGLGEKLTSLLEERREQKSVCSDLLSESITLTAGHRAETAQAGLQSGGTRKAM